MANFLTRLASRVAGLAPVAQPVVPSLFSPDTGLEKSAGQFGFAAEAIVNPIEKHIPTEATREAPLSEELHAGAPDALPFPDRSAAQEARLQVASTVSKNTLVTRPEFINAIHPAEIGVALHDEISESSIQQEPPAARAGFLQTAAFKDESGTPHSAPRVVEDAMTMARRREPGAAFQLAPALAGNGRLLSSRRDRVDSPERESPVIRITIGRIDVRAQFPAPTSSSTSTRQARPPALSLDEYLKQRSEGKR